MDEEDDDFDLYQHNPPPEAAGSGQDDDYDEEEDAYREPFLKGLGRPILGYRNWIAYPNEREGPGTRAVLYNDRLANSVQVDFNLIQRWQPHLMLDQSSTSQLIQEH